MITDFNWNNKTSCPFACERQFYQPSSIQVFILFFQIFVLQLDVKYNKADGFKLTSSDNPVQVSLVVSMDEENDLIQSETITYPISELLADIGGAAGLFLGLSVVAK